MASPSSTLTRRGSTEWFLTSEKCFDDFGCETPEGFPSKPWILYNAFENTGEIYFSKSFTGELWHSLKLVDLAATPRPEPGITVTKIAHDAVKVIDNRAQKRRRRRARRRKKIVKSSSIPSIYQGKPIATDVHTERADAIEDALMRINACNSCQSPWMKLDEAKRVALSEAKSTLPRKKRHKKQKKRIRIRRIRRNALPTAAPPAATGMHKVPEPKCFQLPQADSCSTKVSTTTPMVARLPTGSNTIPSKSKQQLMRNVWLGMT